MNTPPVHIFHRQPNPAGLDRRAPRMVDLDEYMAIQPSALERAFFGFFGMEEEKPYDMHGSVAVVSIDGPLMQRGGWWYDGYAAIRERFVAALNDRQVTSVVLKINSPGGVCAGCFSAARQMRAMKEEAGKPVFTYADENAYSAAYAMACISDEIYLPPEGGVGSVGVIGVLEDYTAFNEKMGIKVAVITSGEYKSDGHPDVPLTKAVVDRYQARINQLAQAFATVVGDARGMTLEAVLKLEAACLYGDGAVKAGLANGVATFEEVIDMAQTKGVSAMKSTRARTHVGALGARQGNPMTIKTQAGSASASQEVLGAELVYEPSHTDFALAAGLAHDASKGDVLAKMAKDRVDTDAARAVSAKLLGAIGASSSEEAIAKLTANETKLDELVKAITGDEKSTVEDAIKKLEADRKAADVVKAKALIEKASADGKTAGEKAFGIFERLGMAALEAHLDALVPHDTLVKAKTGDVPAQKSDLTGTKPSTASNKDEEIVVTLSADDKRFCEKHGISEESFIAARKDELATARENQRKRDS